MAAGNYLSFSPFNNFEARVFNPGFLNQVVLNDELVLLLPRR